VSSRDYARDFPEGRIHPPAGIYVKLRIYVNYQAMIAIIGVKSDGFDLDTIESICRSMPPD